MQLIDLLEKYYIRYAICKDIAKLRKFFLRVDMLARAVSGIKAESGGVSVCKMMRINMLSNIISKM
jgi:hypothetical protein